MEAATEVRGSRAPTVYSPETIEAQYEYRTTKRQPRGRRPQGRRGAVRRAAGLVESGSGRSGDCPTSATPGPVVASGEWGLRPPAHPAARPQVHPTSTRFHFPDRFRQVPRLGVMLVGWGGNNGSTLTAAVCWPTDQRLSWPTRTGRKVGGVGWGSVGERASLESLRRGRGSNGGVGP